MVIRTTLGMKDCIVVGVSTNIDKYREAFLAAGVDDGEWVGG